MGNILWARRILDAMGEAFPEFVILQLGKFLGVSLEEALYVPSTVGDIHSEED